MKRRAALLVTAAVLVAGTASSAAGAAAAVPPDTVPPDTVPPSSVLDTLPVLVGPETGAATPDPAAAPSEPLVQIPSGCPAPPVASVVFVGTLLAKDDSTARYRVDQVRAGNADGYVVTGLVDVRYDDETQYLDLDDVYLVGAAPFGVASALGSKVRETAALFGGNAIIGLTERSAECPVIEDPVRTLHLDGTEVETSVFTGLADSKRSIAMAFVKPSAIAIGVILVLATIRWLFTAIFASFRQAAAGEPIGYRRRQH